LEYLITGNTVYQELIRGNIHYYSILTRPGTGLNLVLPERLEAPEPILRAAISLPLRKSDANIDRPALQPTLRQSNTANGGNTVSKMIDALARITDLPVPNLTYFDYGPFSVTHPMFYEQGQNPSDFGFPPISPYLGPWGRMIP
jgi:hypothetical protein